MIWVSIIASLILLFSIIGGIKEGAVKQFFSLISLLIAIPIAGISYHLLAGLLSFISGENWENFLGFFIMLAVIIVILHFIFLLPRSLFEKAWNKGLLFWVIGAVFNIFNAALGMVVFTLVLHAYPIFDWLERAVSGSVVLTWLVSQMSFVQSMLPEVFRQAATMVGLISNFRLY
jgi:uncharacterized membrane protein required for colicin V production